MAKIVATNDRGEPSEGRMPNAPLQCAIRDATPSDVPSVLALIASLSMVRDHADVISKSGFLRQRHSTVDYERFAAEDRIKLAVIHDHPVAYILSFPWSSPNLNLERQVTGTVQWTGESYADPEHPVFRNAIYIGEIGVAPTLARRGIGRSLYNELFTLHPNANIIATTMEAPVFNRAAAAFHHATGFTRVGSFSVPEFFGLSPYQSGVYLKLCGGGY